ncbi:MAG: hypothetical protein J6W12_01285 [Bacteroidales bacterium]|nr:hypothetical protein [Bacteroidales bacterium]
MKRIFVFIIAMLISVVSAFGQVNEYECNTSAPEEKAFLTLCDNGVYIFGFRLDWKDIYAERIISNGLYEHHNDTIVLNDQVNGYQMLVKKGENNDILVVRGWCFMKNMKLYYKENHSYNKTNYDSTYYTSDSMHSLENLIKERETYRHQTVLRDFKPGAYEVAQDSDNKLIINTDGTYQNYLTAGTWKRKGNLITFYDNCLGEAFTAFIEDGFIVVKHRFYYYKNDKLQIFPE